MKQLLSFFLIMGILISFSPATIAAVRDNGTTIDVVKISDADLTPVADEDPDAHLAFTLENDAHYTVSRHYWRDETDNTSYFSIFVRENTYTCCFELTPDEGYRFTENTVVFINDSMDNVSKLELKSNGTLRIWSLPTVAGMGWPAGYLFYENFENFDPKWWVMYDLDFDGRSWYKSVSGTDTKVYEGEHCMVSTSPAEIDDEFPPDDWIISHAFHCTDGAKLSWYHCSQSTSIEEAYTVYILPSDFTNLAPREEIWDGNAPVSYENVTVDLSKYAGRDICIVFNHHGKVASKSLNIDLLTVTDAGYTHIDAVSIKRADIYPVIGDAACDHYNYSPDADKHYTVTNHYWFDETAHTRTVENFIEGHAYSSCFVLAPHEHYYFDTNTRVSINGESDLICVINSDGSLTVRTKPADAMTSIPAFPGDANGDLGIDTADAVEILRIVIGIQEPDERQKIAADANKNGTITTADATYVLKTAAGMIEG